MIASRRGCGVALSIVVVLLVSRYVLGEDRQARQLMQAVQANFDMVATVSCTLTVSSRVEYAHSGAQPLVNVAVSRLWLKRPDKMRAEQPGGVVEITNGTDHWVLDGTGAEMGQPRARRRGPVCALHPAYLWSFSDALGGLEVGMAGPADGLLVLEARIKGMMRQGYRQFHVNPRTRCVERVVVFDPQGQVSHKTDLTYESVNGVRFPTSIVEVFHGAHNTTRITYEYSKVRLNEGLSDSLFNP